MPGVNKVIWTLWSQGFEVAPPIVLSCAESWKRHNPDWQFVQLSDDTISDYIDPARLPPGFADLPHVTQADILRTLLLESYGGVWADATCYCTTPLNDWIPHHADKGFFAFANPAPDRMMASWFLYGASGDPILKALSEALVSVFRDNPGLKQGPDKYMEPFKDDKRWVFFSDLYLKELKMYPYFIFHYTFEKLYLENPIFADSWDAIEKFPASGPLELGGPEQLESPLNPHFVSMLSGEGCPVYKLTWKLGGRAAQPGSLRHYIETLPASRDRHRVAPNVAVDLTVEKITPNDVQSPDYFPFHVDFDRRLLSFIRLNEAAFREEPYLDRRCKGADTIAGSMPIDRIEDVIELVPSRRIHFVMHIGYALSTLLTRCLQELTREQVLREPLSLTNLADRQPDFSQPAGSEMDNTIWGRTLELVLRLYGRCYAGQSGVIVKAHDRAFPLARHLLARDPATKILYLYLDVRQFAYAVLRDEGRRAWGRDSLAQTIRTAPQLAGLPDIETLSDAQCAVLLWLGRTSGLQQLLDDRGSDRVLAMHGARIADDTVSSLMTILDFFGLPAVPEQVESIAHGPIFSKHAKSRSRGFSPDDRRQQMRDFEDLFGSEIDDALTWASDWFPTIAVAATERDSIPG